MNCKIMRLDFRKIQNGCNTRVEENAFNTLSDFLNGNITGNAFDRERQIKAYSEIAANNDGTSGEKIYRFVSDKLLR